MFDVLDPQPNRNTSSEEKMTIGDFIEGRDSSVSDPKVALRKEEGSRVDGRDFISHCDQDFTNPRW